MRYFFVFMIGVGLVFSAKAQFAASDHMNPMDHGPFISSTISLDPLSSMGVPRDILVHKGIAVKVGPESSPATMAFDTDLLRIAGAWTGGSLHWYLARDGFQEWPSPAGFLHFTNNQRPGWSLNRDFRDPRPWRYGPVPESLGRYKGLYLHGDKVVFSYRVGDSEILESPGFVSILNQPVFTRTLNLYPTVETLSMHVLEAPDGHRVSLEKEMVTDTKGLLQIRIGNESRLVGFQGVPEGAEWRLANRHLILDFPSMEQPVRLELAIGPVLSDTDSDYMVTYLGQGSEITDLSLFKEPGPARWDVLETEAEFGSENGPFTVDTFTVPAENLWNSFIRLSDVDFLSDGRAVVASMSGDVWLVDGIGETAGTLYWKRFATGLNQPLGLKVVDDNIYVTGRDQITILHDRNGNDEADFYENFNNQVMAATNFHAFTMNLQTDSQGNFYFAKATPWPPWTDPMGGANENRHYAEITPHHGVLFRVSPDGRNLEVIATGLRNPNGLTVGPNDEIIYSDNEGNWIPASFVQRIREGGFHGFVPSAHMDKMPGDEDFQKPIVWTPHFVDNSPSQPLFITSDQWPEDLHGHLLLNSYGRANVSLILKEEVDGEWQGAHLVLPLEFKSGLERARFHDDGHLYIAGLTSWQSIGEDWGSFHRVRYTGKPLYLPVDLKTKPGGLELRFAEELDSETASDLNNYHIEQWTYPWTSQYGTQNRVYSVKDPGETGMDRVEIRSVSLSGDRKTVFIEIPKLTPGPVESRVPILESLPDQKDASLGLIMAIDYKFTALDGTEMDHLIHKTIHRVPTGE